MDISKNTEKSTQEKITLFRSFFSGLPHVYGTYNPATGKARQEKMPVTDNVLFDHLKGKKPYGVYLLVEDHVRVIVVDFDDMDTYRPKEFINCANHFGLYSYIEISKSKGFHVWIFFDENGVKAFKARLVVKFLLDEIGYPDTEIFPKQDFLDSETSFGNFINAPLFGSLVPEGKTVFLDPHTLNPYTDQWYFLESVTRVNESILDEIIEVNDLSAVPSLQTSIDLDKKDQNSFMLPPCAIKMFRDGVTRYQRVSCFRLAIHLKRLGFPFDVAMAALKAWALKNRPSDGKEVIEESEIISQASYAFNHSYNGYACNSEAISPFCVPSCPVRQWIESHKEPRTEKQKIDRNCEQSLSISES